MSFWIDFVVWDLIALYSACVWLPTPKGRRWITKTRSALALWLHRRLCRPERCDNRGDSWLRSQRPAVVYFLIRLPLRVAVSSMLWAAEVALSHRTFPHLLVLLAFLMFFAKPLSRLWEQTEQMVDVIQKSPWMSAQRMLR